jgi:hypothetical protein
MALAREPPLVDPAVFYCQQAAEKLIKAPAIKVPRVHNLEMLSALAAPAYPHLASSMADFGPATVWIARTRYPGLTDDGGTTAQEVADMLDVIRTFRDKAVALAPFPA